MPLTKQYLRYEAAEAFGVICSRKTGAILYQKRDKGGTKKIYAVSPALEHVVIWDLKTGLKAAVFGGSTREVTCLRLQEGSSALAVGYEDGLVKLWDLESRECHVTFSGHKSAVQCLAFDREGTRLVSGGKDTDVIVWDVVNESGLYRLKGHKGPVTSCLFLDDYNVLITCSKDTFVKLWDLHTQHCFQTIVDHRSEVWSGTLIRNGTRLITTSSDVELRVYDLTSSDSSKVAPVLCQLLGSIKRGSRSRPLCLAVDGEGLNMVVMNNEFSLDVFNISGDGEVEKKRKKRIKNLKKKAKEGGNEWVEEEVEHPINDELPLVYTFNTSNKMRSCDILKTSPDTLQILISLYSNSLQLYNIDISNSTDTLIYSIELCGHRSDIRTVSISSDGTLIASGSSDMVKVWNTSSRVCLHTLPSGYAVTSCFVPGDRHLLVGVKSGDLLLYDISSGSLLESFPAHSLSIWSIDVSPNRRGFITGSADKDVKFWEFELTTDIANPGRKQLTAVHVKTLKMSEDVLCIKHSPNEKVLAVSLLDSTVKVFFVDTLKFFLSLYGHKLPVLCMDISHDSNLMVTGSADKNIRIWGLDYGDCHRSIFAHDDSIMAIQFIPKTHLCFTVSKDKLLKCWDVDHFELIQTLKGHHSEVWSLAVSSDGNLVVTGSHDLSLRFWECTREPLVLSEERENEREVEFENSLVSENQPVVPGEHDNGEVAMAGKKTVDTLKSTERIMEAIEIWREEMFKLEEYREECKEAGKILPLPPIHPVLKVFGNITSEKYVLNVLKQVKSSELESSLLVLPFTDAMDFLRLCNVWLEKGWEIEVVSRCALFLVRIHFNQITSSKLLLPIIDLLRQILPQRILDLKDMCGFNLAGLKHLQRENELKKEDQTVFTDISHQPHSNKNRKKRHRQ